MRMGGIWYEAVELARSFLHRNCADIKISVQHNARHDYLRQPPLRNPKLIVKSLTKDGQELVHITS